VSHLHRRVRHPPRFGRPEKVALSTSSTYIGKLTSASSRSRSSSDTTNMRFCNGSFQSTMTQRATDQIGEGSHK
jgi:hypothetical protein